MSSAWSDSDWKLRLTRDLEPVLKSPQVARELSTYQGVPFGLFAYPPTAERQLRREARMLATRLENETPRKVATISMADLLWEAIRVAYPPDGAALFEAERSMASESPERRLEQLQETIRAVVSEVSPLPQMIVKRIEGLDPAKTFLFLTRVGALYPAYRASALLENLMGVVRIPTILFYPGTRTGTNTLRFMDSLDALHGYRHRIF